MFRRLKELHLKIWFASQMAAALSFGPSWASYVIYALAVIVLLSLAVGVVLLFVWPFILSAFWQRVREVTVSLPLRALATAVFLIVGIVFYVLKTYLRRTYALAEIVIGLASCWAGLGNPSPNSLSASLSVGAGTYIIVRGIDNFLHGDKKEVDEVDKVPVGSSAEKS